MEDKEREIRLQFLDEASEYLDTLEATLLDIARRGVDNHEMNGALRAAHSIKGGAALMGYGLTSDLAHRLEDSLKVLKIQRADGVTCDVEGQMLGAVDAIRQVVECDRTSQSIEKTWLNSSVLPIFDWLSDRLGEPSAEDAASMMDADEGQNVMPLIFQTEVEGSLEQLEVLIDDYANSTQPERFSQLQSALTVMAQELAGLGEMLDLPAFIQLCQSVEKFASGAANESQLQEVAQKTLEIWRRAQALVLTDNVDSMPDQLTGLSFGLIGIEFDEVGSEVRLKAADQAADQPLDETDWNRLGNENDALDDVFAGLGDEDDALVDDVFAGLGDEDDALADDVFAGLGDEDDALVDDVFASLGEPSEKVSDAFSSGFEGEPALDLAAVETDETAETADAFAGVFDEDLSRSETPESSGFSAAKAASSSQSSGGGTEFRFSESPKPQAETADLDDNTVRVSVRKLNELNDHFGELTIERNRLEAEVKRMRTLVKDMSRKLRSLDEINDDVRDIYEQPDSSLLLAASRPTALLGAAPNRLTFGAVGESSRVTHLGGASNGPGRASTASNGSSDGRSADQGPGFREGFDALEFDRYNDSHLPFRQIVESVVKLQEVADDLELSVDKTEQTARAIHRTARHLQRNLNQLRMRPLSDITNRFPRALRELEMAHGKQVTLALEGEGTLIDRNILEALSDPLMHIVRNAFDHGIERPDQRQQKDKPGRGTIAIRAFNRSNRTIITISDDGSGIALEKIRDRAQSMGLDAELLAAATEPELLSLIFEPGFSTSDEVTALSGRGVGMDVVRNNLTQIRGDISVETAAGRGTTFTISVPYTLSVTRIMLAEGNRMPVAIPTDTIEEVTVIDDNDMYETEGRETFHFKGDAVRLIRLANWIEFNCPRHIDSLEAVPNMDKPSVLIFRMGEVRYGLQIERSWGEQEVAVRRVEGPISLPAGFSNCTILGDGRVVPLVSLSDLARWVMGCEAADIYSAKSLYSNPVTGGAIDPVSLQAVPDEVKRRSRFLVIDDSVNVRRLLALTLEKAGYEVEQARDGQDAMEKLETGLLIDGIVCDVEMPRMDGYSFLSKLRSLDEFAHLPVTMLTSRSGEKHRDLAMNLGATAYFSKPYQERVLLQSLEETLVASQQVKA
mgnify:CR=1 FL=1